MMIGMTTVVLSLLLAWNDAYTAAVCGAALGVVVAMALVVIWLVERQESGW